MQGNDHSVGSKPTLEELKRLIEKTQDLEHRQISECMVILLSALEVGADADRLTQRTGCQREFIEAISRRMRQAGLWIGEMVDDQEWWDQDDNLRVFALFTHALVALGQLTRKRTEGGGCSYIDPQTGEVVDEWSPA